MSIASALRTWRNAGRDPEIDTLCASLMRWLECTAEQIEGGRLYSADGVRGLVSPCLPQSSTYNSVAFSEPDALFTSIDQIENKFRDADIQVWSVLVPPRANGVNRFLRDRGYRSADGPEAMCRGLEGLPPRRFELELVASPSAEEMAEVNARSYGYPPGVFGKLFSGQPAGLFPYLAMKGGRPAATIQIIDMGHDATVFGMATAPEFQRQGLARELLVHGLAEARDRGQSCSTLEASPDGRPLYESVGYRSLGAMKLWERSGS